MRTLILSYLFVVSTLGALSQTATIKGRVIGTTREHILYTIPENDIFNPFLFDSVSLKKNGRFEIKLELERPAFVRLRTAGTMLHETTCLIEPGITIELDILHEENRRFIKVYGFYATLHSLLNSPPRSQNIEISYLDNFRWSKKLQLIRQEIAFLRDSAINKLYEIQQKHSFSPRLLKYAEDELNAFYNYREGIGYRICRNDPEDAKQEALYSLAGRSMPSPALLAVPSGYRFLSILSEPFTSTATFNPSTKEFRDAEIRRATEILGKEMVAYYELFRLCKTANSTHLSKFPYNYRENTGYLRNHLDWYKEIIEKYPESPCLTVVMPYYDNLKEYFKKVDSSTDLGIHFIDSGQVSYLDNLIKYFPEKNIHCILWSTTHVMPQEKISVPEDENSVVVYIMLDNISQESWKNNIRYHDIKGYHIEANSTLRREIRNTWLLSKPNFIKRPYITYSVQTGIWKGKGYVPNVLDRIEKREKLPPLFKFEGILSENAPVSPAHSIQKVEVIKDTISYRNKTYDGLISYEFDEVTDFRSLSEIGKRYIFNNNPVLYMINNKIVTKNPDDYYIDMDYIFKVETTIPDQIPSLKDTSILFTILRILTGTEQNKIDAERVYIR